jgi:CHAD domain-containing protein
MLDAELVRRLAAALRPKFTVLAGESRHRTRVCLDTFDWRLHRKGMALTAVSSRGSDEQTLVLTGPDGVTVSAGPDPLGWPRLAADLPEPLRALLAPVLQVRALLPVVEVTGSVATGQLLDAEQKTVLRLVHERPAALTSGTLTPGVTGTVAGGSVPGRLRLIPVRGYAGHLAKVARTLRAAGLHPADPTGFAPALAAAGIDPDAVPPPAMQADLPAGVAVARVLLSFLDELEATHAGTVADIDIEFLHEFRVAVRRSRSVLKLLADVLPPALVAWAGPQLKWLGDLTTPVRDLDVHLEEVPALTDRLTSGSPEDLEPLTGYLLTLRRRELRTLVRGLRSVRFERFRARWRTELEALAQEAPAADGRVADGLVADGPTAAQLGAERLARADRRVLRPGSRITPDSPAEDLHDLRKRCKELRYLLEIFSPLLDPADARAAVKELKLLQDVLGTFQDSEVQREAIYSMADDLLAAGSTSARTLLALGEIAATMYADQLAARARFATAFAQFAQPAVHRRLTRLPAAPQAPAPTATPTATSTAKQPSS